MCDNLKKKIDNYYPKYKTQLSYEEYLPCWITKYKDINNNKYIVYYFRDLLINIYNDYILELIIQSLYIKFEQFYISIS